MICYGTDSPHVYRWDGGFTHGRDRFLGYVDFRPIAMIRNPVRKEAVDVAILIFLVPAGALYASAFPETTISVCSLITGLILWVCTR